VLYIIWGLTKHQATPYCTGPKNIRWRLFQVFRTYRSCRHPLTEGCGVWTHISDLCTLCSI